MGCRIINLTRPSTGITSRLGSSRSVAVHAIVAPAPSPRQAIVSTCVRAVDSGRAPQSYPPPARTTATGHHRKPDRDKSVFALVGGVVGGAVRT